MEDSFKEFIGDRKLVIFGTGEQAKKLVSELEMYSIAFFVDNSPEKQKQCFMGRNVFEPNILDKENKGEIFIIVASMYYTEIKKQLVDMGFKEGLNFEKSDYVKYMGDDFFCPFCEEGFGHFLPMGNKAEVFKNNQIIGGGYRENAICPKCHSMDRERHIFLYLKEKTDIFHSNKRVLHIAPEENLRTELSKNRSIDYVPGDLYPQPGKGINSLDVTGLPFGDNYFDVVLCNHVLEHVHDDRKAMKELYRVLKSDGWAILQVPLSISLERTYEDPSVNTPEERLEKFGQKDHVRLYGMDYVDRLESIGFHVKVYSYLQEHVSKLAEQYGLMKDENIFVCYK